MIDLFGDEITAPTTIPAKGILNAALGFAEFWTLWPAGPRKVAKQQALNKWATVGAARHADVILKHVRWLKVSDEWARGFVPQPCTYLNQQRWIDWEPVDVIERPAVDPALAKIHADRKAAAPMPAAVKARIDAMRGRRAA